MMLRFRSLGVSRLPTSQRLLRSSFAPKYFLTSYSSNTQVPLETTPIKKDTQTPEPPTNEITANKTDATLPWYLQMTQLKEERDLVKANEQVNIKFPPNSPQSLEQMCNFLAKEQGMKDIVIFDMRNQDVLTSKMADFMVIATAKSIKHCQSTFLELNKLIKRDYNQFAYLEGNINQNEEKKRKKRMLRKNNLGGVWNVNKRNINTHDSNEAWYMIDTRTDNIFVNILTEQRRTELNLEELYAPENEKSEWSNQNTTIPQKQSSNDLLDVNDENNVLAGLRRLAEQRRQYSTSSRHYSIITRVSNIKLTEQITKLLKNKDFDTCGKLILKELDTPNSVKNLDILIATKNSLVNELSHSSEEPVDIKSWMQTFDLAWPLSLPEDENEFWMVRNEFLKLLAFSQNNMVGMRLFTNEYFKVKMYHNSKISMGEINTFLSLSVSKLRKIKSKRSGTKTLKNQNKTISDFLDLFIGHRLESQILRNPKTLELLLETMIYDQETRLVSMPRTINHLSSIPQLPEQVIESIISILSSNNLWPELFKFWKERSSRIVDGQDKRPWLQFLQAVTKCDDQNILAAFIENGNLLWLLRYRINITPEMSNELKVLFSKADPENIAFKYQRAQFNL